jgi:GT2 family glycosyltransferase
MNHASKNQALIVLGMHRSGTSALTGVLSWLGVDLGQQLLPQHATNERGFWENFQVVEGNENVLKTLNTTWFNPAPFPKFWWQYETLIPLRDYLAKVLRHNFAGCPLWGLKDPRLCRLLPLWGPLLEATGSALGFVIMVRNPHEVAASLARRDGLSANTAVHLWLENVLAAEQDTRAFRRVFVTYDELLENGEETVDKIARDLNVNWPIRFEWVADQIERFLSSDLKHHHNVATPQLDRKLAAWSETVYWALRGEAEGNHDSFNVLETVRAALIKYKSSKTLEPIFRLPVFDRYEQWIEKQKLIRVSWLVRGFHEKRLAETVRFHFLIHLRRDQEALLKMTLEGLLALDYADWFLSIIADFSTIDPAVWGVKNLRWVMIDSEPVAAINREINVIGADWVALIDAGDRFEPDSLSICCRAIKTHSDWQLIYVDEDRINAEGVRFDPKFKPDFNLDGLRAMPYLGRFCLVRREAVEAVGGYAPYWGAAYYDMAFRIFEQYGEGAMGHLAQLLFHRFDVNELSDRGLLSKWRAKINASADFGKEIVSQHLKRQGIQAAVYETDFPDCYWIDYPVQYPALVSIIIATRNSGQALQRCLLSLFQHTHYEQYEIIVVDNDSDDLATLDYLETLKTDKRIHVLRYAVEGNAAQLNNFAAQHAKGEYLLFLNDDAELIQAEWLRRLVALIQRDDVGIVGARVLDADHKVLHAGLILGIGMVGIAGQINQGLAKHDAGYLARNQVTHTLSAVSDACMMIDRALYETVGGMAEDGVLFNEVDLCLKVGKLGYKIVWTPQVTLIQHGLGSLVRHRGRAIQKTQVENEIAVMYQKCLPQLCNDPAYNPHLALMGKEWEPEIEITVPWDVNLKRAADEPRRIVAFPYNAWASGEYRVRAPLRALHDAGVAHYALMPNDEAHRVPTLTELERMQPDTLLLHNALHDDHLTALAQYQRFNQAFKVFGQDDLIYALPKNNPYAKTNYKDIKQRVYKALSCCDRLIVTTEPLAEAYRSVISDIRVIPNYLEQHRWAHLSARRGVGQKPRIGWAGAAQHQGDLQLMIPVVKALADEVDWIFFGLCPEALRPYLHEYYNMVPFAQYSAKLASLNLDLAIAPLEQNAFNEAKSNLRLLEYGILGYPVVCSDIYPYQNAPVARVANTPEAWIEAIRERLYDLEAAFAEGDLLKQWVVEQWLLDHHLNDWALALNCFDFKSPLDAPVQKQAHLEEHSKKINHFNTLHSNHSQTTEKIEQVKGSAQSLRWIFLLGCRHSGIDLLTALLREHDSIAWCHESERFFKHLESPEIKIPQFWTEQEALVRFSKEDKRHPIEPKTWIQSLDKPDARAVLAQTTDNLIAKIPWLQQHFPNAYFILMVRNGYTCALKYRDDVLKEYGLQPLLLHRAARHWARSLLILQEDAPDNARLFTMRYEDLIADPTDVTNKLFDFIGLPAIAPPAQIVAAQQSTRLGSISAEQKAVINNAAGDMLAFYGYI